MSWLKGCVACNIGIIEEMDRFIEGGHSELQAAGELYKQQMKELPEEVYSINSILQRYRYNTNKKKVCQNDKQVSAKQIDGQKSLNQEWPTCSECPRPVEKVSRSGNPNKSGMCRTCRQRAAQDGEYQKGKEKFDQIPIDEEEDRYWREIAEDLKRVLEDTPELPSPFIEVKVGKVRPETASLMDEVESIVKRISSQLHRSSEYWMPIK
jgi:hypothetical protein